MEVQTKFTVTAFIACLLTLTQCPTAGSYEQPGDICEMEGGMKGTCEDVFECLQTGGVARRNGQVTVCWQDGLNIYVCCRRPHLVARELCDAWRQYWRQDDGRCNIHHPLIYGGEEANIGEFPHVVLVGKSIKRSRKIHYDCGGTLLSPHFVLTAGHCVPFDTEDTIIWAKLGEHNLEYDTEETLQRLQGPMPSALYGVEDLTFDPTDNTTNTAPVEQVLQVENVFIYPDYLYLRRNYHDIALLKLKHPAKFTARVLPACLPYQFPADTHEGQDLTVVGWGRTEYARVSATLQKVNVTVVDRLECSTTKNLNRPDTTPLGITEDMICAGGRKKDSCSGDSGGPLTIRSPVNSSTCEHTIVGVVSFGVGHGRSPCGRIGVYTRVSAYLDWITGYIAPNGAGATYQDESIPVNRAGDLDLNFTESGPLLNRMLQPLSDGEAEPSLVFEGFSELHEAEPSTSTTRVTEAQPIPILFPGRR